MLLQKDGSYTEKPPELPAATTWQPDGNQTSTQVSIGKVSEGQDSIVEGSVVPATTDEMMCLHDHFGKGVVFLTQNQLDSLMNKLGQVIFHHYVDKLATFIIDKNANVKNHYETILKWWRRDSKLEKR